MRFIRIFGIFLDFLGISGFFGIFLNFLGLVTQKRPCHPNVAFQVGLWENRHLDAPLLFGGWPLCFDGEVEIRLNVAQQLIYS